MKSLSIRTKILDIVAFPVLALSVFGVWDVTRVANDYQAHRVIGPLTEISRLGASVVHELQKERGRTVGLITSDYSADGLSAVANQRRLSDSAITEFRAGALTFSGSEALEDHISGLLKDLDRVDAHRLSVDERSVTVGENVSFYTGNIENLMHIIAIAAKQSPSKEVEEQLLVYRTLVEAKEHGGLERAIGSALLNEAAAGVFNSGRYNVYRSRLAGEATMLAEFRLFAQPEHMALFERAMQGSAIDQVAEWRKVLAALPETRDGKGISGAEWFNTATERLNKMKSVEDAVGVVATDTAAGVESALYNKLVLEIVFLGFVAFVSIGLTFLVLRDVLRALTDVSDEIGAVTANQEWTGRNHGQRSDEIGTIARAVGLMRENNERVARLQAEEEKIKERAERDKEAALRALADRFRAGVGRLINEVETSADLISSTSVACREQVSNSRSEVTVVEQSSGQAAANVQSVAAAAEELTASIGEIGSQVRTAADVAQRAVVQSAETKEGAVALKGNADEIGAIVSLIQEIAEQTNLLALNATIEAARAGESGKGFAVVASEVKDLAGQTQKATEQITGQVQAIQSAAQTMSDSASAIGNTIDEISEVANSISAAVDQQNGATAEIAEASSRTSAEAQRAGERVQNLSTVVSATIDSMEELYGASDALRGNAKTLRKTAEEFAEQIVAA